jgi:hypothetical protein
VSLPQGLRAARAVLFGGAPDAHMLCYRARQLLAVVCAGDLEGFVLKPDPRTTYDFGADDLFRDDLFRPSVNAVQAGQGTLTVLGRPALPDVTGRARHLFDVEVLDGAGTVRVTRRVPPIQIVEFRLDDAAPLPGAGYYLHVDLPAAGQRWRVEVVNRPSDNLSALCAGLGKIGESAADALFGVSRDQPYLTFRNLWRGAVEMPLRLGAAVCALVYRTEERRLSGG